MTRIQTLELLLVVDKTDEGYVALVRQSPAGQGQTRFVNPLAPRDLAGFWAALSQLPRGGHPTPELAARIRAAGQQLFDAVFRGEVLGCLRASFDIARMEQAILRIQLDCSTVPELETL
ncbi:MAG: hypothetical protein DCC57_10730, partial [Chloroflexi bacterium]